MTNCSKTIYGDWARKRQCSRKAVKDGFCKQHHPDTVVARDKKNQERWEAERENTPTAKLYRALDRIKELESKLAYQSKEREILRKELNRFEGHKSPFDVSPIIMASHVDGYEEHGFGGCCWGTGEKYFDRHKSDYAASLYYSKKYVDEIRAQLSDALQSLPSNP